MHEFIAGVMQAVVETFTSPEPILEIGSYQVEGQEHIINLRTLFPGKSYLGIDVRSGPGVDSVENVERLRFGDMTVGTVIALNVFEHVPHFWRAFEEVRRVLRPDGLLIVSCPFYFYIHEFPNDYWRFTPDALHLLLAEFPTKIVGYNGPSKRPLHVWAVAAGREHPRITNAQHLIFRERIHRYARQPLAWDKKVRYRIGRLLCGRGPFMPFLDAEEFDTILIETN